MPNKVESSSDTMREKSPIRYAAWFGMSISYPTFCIAGSRVNAQMVIAQISSNVMSFSPSFIGSDLGWISGVVCIPTNWRPGHSSV
jgi:hypothetical protein